MASNEKTFEKDRAEALRLLNDPNPNQAELIKLYIGELDRDLHREFTPLLNGEEFELMGQKLSNESIAAIIRLKHYRLNVMDAAQHLYNIKEKVKGVLAIIMAELRDWSNAESTEAAVNIALMALPLKPRHNRAKLIADNIQLLGCKASVENGLIHLQMLDPGLKSKLETAKEETATMFSQYKGCYNAVKDYMKKRHLILPASTAILKEYEQELAGYYDTWGLNKYNTTPLGIEKLKEGVTTLQGLYNIVASYKDAEPSQEAYQYMLKAFFNKEKDTIKR